MVNAQSAKPKVSSKLSPAIPERRSSDATNATTPLAWMSCSSKTRLYMISKASFVGAVVAQPGRALDLFGVKLKTELS